MEGGLQAMHIHEQVSLNAWEIDGFSNMWLTVMGSEIQTKMNPKLGTQKKICLGNGVTEKWICIPGRLLLKTSPDLPMIRQHECHLSLAFPWIWVWCICSHMAPLKIWFAWSNACLRYLKDLSTGGILLLKEYSKGLGFHAVHSVKSHLDAHESKAHLSSGYLQ